MKRTDRSVRELLDAFRSSEPTPGGGSASALAGAIGAALLAMVAGLGRPRATSDEDLARLAAAGRRSTEISDELLALVDRDSEAYEAVMKAYKMPKGTEEEKRTRTDEIQAALAEATAAPLAVMRHCAAAIEEAAAVAALGNANASSDVQVARELLEAGLRGAKSNVEINLASLKDPRMAENIRREVARLTATTTDCRPPTND
jgi:formiminotetrahydrofolate cyclodeaminase